MNEPSAAEDESAEELYERAPCGLLATAPDGTVLRVNTTFLEWTGYQRHEIVGTRRFSDLLTPGGRIYHETHFAPLLRMHGKVNGIVFDLVCSDQHRLPVFVHSVVKQAADGRPLMIKTTILDATERREYERELLRARKVAELSDQRIRIVHRVVAETTSGRDRAGVSDTLARVLRESFNASGAAIWLFDDERSTLALASIDGTPLFPEFALIPTDSPAPPAGACRRREPVVVDSWQQASREFPLLVAGNSRLEALIAVPIASGDVILGAYAVYFARSRTFGADDVALHRTLGYHAGQALESSALHEELRHRASHDSLTDMPNRADFDDRLEQALARAGRNETPVAVMVLDLDGFKGVNDRLGHRAGDQVLVETAQRLRRAVRPYDSVARVGGDEFTVLCEGAGPDEAGRIAHRIHEALRDPILISGEKVSGGGSIGAAVYFPRPGQPPPTPAELLHDADIAMYRAKATGVNRHTVLGPTPAGR